MWESADTTTSNAAAFNSQMSFYEYPSHKPFINTIHSPLRPAHTLSRTAALPESNRDQLLSALQSLSIRIKKLEHDREVGIRMKGKRIPISIFSSIRSSPASRNQVA